MSYEVLPLQYRAWRALADPIPTYLHDCFDKIDIRRDEATRVLYGASMFGSRGLEFVLAVDMRSQAALRLQELVS